MVGIRYGSKQLSLWSYSGDPSAVSLMIFPLPADGVMPGANQYTKTSRTTKQQQQQQHTKLKKKKKKKKKKESQDADLHTC